MYAGLLEKLKADGCNRPAQDKNDSISIIYCGLGLSPVEGAAFACDLELVEGDGFLWCVV